MHSENDFGLLLVVLVLLVLFIVLLHFYIFYSFLIFFSTNITIHHLLSVFFRIYLKKTGNSSTDRNRC